MISKHRVGAVAACLLVVFVATAASPLDATTLRRMDLPELVTSAERVVHAQVVDRRSYWDESLAQIFTDTDFEVLGEAKGEGPRRLTITLMGGTVGIIDMIVPGTPVFEVDDEAVLFVESRPDGRKHLVGLSQGAMRIVRDPETGERVAVSAVHGGVSYLQREGDRLRPVRVSPQRVPLRSLMDGIREMVRDGHSRGSLVSDTPASISRRPVGREQR